jgi:lipopolysaccharide biosynthesis glycosyltransferase
MNNKETKKEIIPVFFAVDDNYVPYLAVSLNSLIINATEKYNYHINVLIDTLSEENIKVLGSMATENVKIDFVPVVERLRKICHRLHLRDYYSKATYYRFFIPEMFSQYDRGVYLDCDVVLADDVANLYHCIMGDDLVAGVPEEVMLNEDVFGTYVEKVLHIPRSVYFNAGVIVMNLAEMRRINIEEQFATLLGKYTYRVTQDQDYLNVICYKRSTILDFVWNKTPLPNSPRDITPKIAHYKLNYKPWRYDDIPYEELFWKYAEGTCFYSLLREIKENYSEEEKARDTMMYESLKELAASEIDAADKAAASKV